MNEWSCSEARERLPDHVTGRLSDEELRRSDDHLRACSGCAAEAELLEALLGSRAEPPPGLASRIRGAVLHDRTPGGAAPGDAPSRGPGRGWLAAAAGLVLALGLGLLWQEVVPGPAEGPLARVALDPVPETWMDDEAVVAGAPVLDDLDDDALLALLEEME